MRPANSQYCQSLEVTRSENLAVKLRQSSVSGRHPRADFASDAAKLGIPKALPKRLAEFISSVFWIFLIVSHGVV